MVLFTIWDYVVFICMLMISASIGIYYRFTGGKQKTTNEYFLAGQNISIYPVSFSLMASFMSAITLLGVAMENYQYGSIFIVINISYILATPIAAYLYLPVFFRLQSTSAYEYLERRFGKETRLCASICYTLQMCLYMGIVLYAPALALEAVSGITKTNSILIIGFVCTFYSTIGGMKAVLITDVFQSLLMFGAVYAIIFVAAYDAGSFKAIWNLASDGGRLNFVNFNPDPKERHSWWSLIIGGGITFLSLYAVNQTQIQRLLTIKDLHRSQIALWLNWPILTLLSLSTSFSGMAIYYYYAKCDPLLQGRITSRDQLMPLFVVDAMGNMPGLPGLFVAGIFSASLSTVSAAVNSLAAVTLEDYIKPIYKQIKGQPLPESKSTLPSKTIACLYGVICIGVAFLAQMLGGILQASLTIFGVVGGPLFGLFTLGMFVPASNQRGAIIGLFTAVIFSLILGFGGPKPIPKILNMSVDNCSRFNRTVTHSVVSNYTHLIQHSESIQQDFIQTDTDNQHHHQSYFWLFEISYMWYGCLGFLIAFLFGWLMSIILDCLHLTGENNNKKTIYLDNECNYINCDLFSPPIARRLKEQNAKRLEKDSNFANIGKYSNTHF